MIYNSTTTLHHTRVDEMHLQTLRPRESSFDKFVPPAKQLFIDTTVSAPSAGSRPPQVRRESSLYGTSKWHECAAYSEVQHATANGVAPSRILLTHPTASSASLRFAAKLGVHTVAVDSVEDVVKIRMHNPRARLVLRINAGDITRPTAALPLAVETANDLLDEAALYKMQVVAVNFHVSTIDLAGFRKAIESSPDLLETALEVEHKLESIGVSADLISCTAVDDTGSPESPLAFPDFHEIQIAHNAFALVS